jgi:L-aspartate oxidase
VHGANRLASNSLLETVVFARRVVDRSRSSPDSTAPESPEPRELSEPHATEAPPLTRQAVQSLLWTEVGIVRSAESLRHAVAALSAWQAALPAVTYRPSQELADLLTCSRLVAEAALLREESRGAHFRTDFPEPRAEWRRHVVFRKAVPATK